MTVTPIPTRTATAAADTAGAATGAHRHRPIEARWLLTGLAFPPAGLLAVTVAPVDGPAGALVAGATAGAVIGGGQWLALRASATRPGLAPRWIGATAVSMALGLALGAGVVGYRTSTVDLVVMGLLTGAVLGPAQALVLHRAGLATRAGAAVWAAAVPALWAVGWFITASAGIDVERQYANFGLFGSMTCSALGALVLGGITRRRRA